MSTAILAILLCLALAAAIWLRDDPDSPTPEEARWNEQVRDRREDEANQLLLSADLHRRDQITLVKIKHFADSSRAPQRWTLAMAELDSLNAEFARDATTVRSNCGRVARARAIAAKHPQWSLGTVADLSCGRIWLGMTDEEAREAYGAPTAVHSTVSLGQDPSEVTQQWVYGGGEYLYFLHHRLATIQR